MTDDDLKPSAVSFQPEPINDNLSGNDLSYKPNAAQSKTWSNETLASELDYKFTSISEMLDAEDGSRASFSDDYRTTEPCTQALPRTNVQNASKSAPAISSRGKALISINQNSPTLNLIAHEDSNTLASQAKTQPQNKNSSSSSTGDHGTKRGYLWLQNKAKLKKFKYYFIPADDLK